MLCPFSYTYTATGKVLTETDALGHTARWTYDENNRTKTYTDRNNQTTQYEYDPMARLVKETEDRGTVLLSCKY